MASNTKIEWATHTFNPWEGCQKTGSPGCEKCYAEKRNARFSGGAAINWGPHAPRRRTSESNWKKPLSWNTNHEAFFAEHGHRQRVFCASLADVFDNAVPRQWRVDLMKLILQTPHLDWLLLTKRIGNASEMLLDAGDAALTELFGSAIYTSFAFTFSNIWVGASIVNQAEAYRDIPKLLAVPATKRFLSMEPLLGPVNLLNVGQGIGGCLKRQANWESGMEVARTPAIDWIIVGGESGPGARPMHPDWARSLRDQCAAAGVPFLFKQWGEWCPESVYGTVKAAKTAQYISPNGEIRPAAFGARNGATTIQHVGKIAAGRTLDGRLWDGIPC